MIKEDGVMMEETLRELGADDKPKKNEVTWEIDEPIKNHDQARIATAVMKRLRRALKHRPTDEVEARYRKVAERLETWMERGSASSR
jgi:hypothetical protein